MKRGDVWWVDFDPSIGGEIQKLRPAVIVSNDAANKYLNRVQVLPLSSAIDKIYPSEARVTFDGVPGKAMADQLTTVSKLRLSRFGGRLTHEEIRDIERAIRLQLDLF